MKLTTNQQLQQLRNEGSDHIADEILELRARTEELQDLINELACVGEFYSRPMQAKVKAMAKVKP